MGNEDGQPGHCCSVLCSISCSVCGRTGLVKRNAVALLVQSKRKDVGRKTRGEMQKWKEENKKTFISVKISCNYWQLLVTSKQHLTLQTFMLFGSKQMDHSFYACLIFLHQFYLLSGFDIF